MVGSAFNRAMAKTLLDRAVQIRLAQLGDKELPTATAMNDMAEILLYQRQVTQAKQLLDVAVSLRHEMLGMYMMYAPLGISNSFFSYLSYLQ